MSVIVRRVFPRIFHIFANQGGEVVLGDVDGKTYLADSIFFNSCAFAEFERNATVPLTEEEVTIEDAEDEL